MERERDFFILEYRPSWRLGDKWTCSLFILADLAYTVLTEHLFLDQLKSTSVFCPSFSSCCSLREVAFRLRSRVSEISSNQSSFNVTPLK